MDNEMFRRLGQGDAALLQAMSCVFEAQEIYERTLRYLGFGLTRTSSMAVRNSQITYAAPVGGGDRYARVPTRYR